MKQNAEDILKKTYFKRYHKGSPEPQWFTKEMKENIKLRKQYSKLWRISENIEHRKSYEAEYKKQKRKVQELIKEGISNYEMKLVREIQENKDRRKLWENVNKLTYGKNNKKHENNIYDENGNHISENDLNETIINYWETIYKKHENNMSIEWNEENRMRYEERFGNDELVRREPTREDSDAENFVALLWRVASGQRHQIQREEFERVQNDRIAQISNTEENESLEWMGEVVFTAEEVRTQLSRLKKRKKAGPNGLRNEIYKWLPESINCMQSLVACLNNVNQSGPPIEWKRSKTVLIPKKNKPMCMDLRPIALTNVSYKIYMSLCKEKIVSHLRKNNQFSPYQAGFTKGKRLEDNLFTISYCINYSRLNKKPLYVCAIDFEKAFDSIKRSCIVKALIKYRCDPLIIDVICQLYENDCTSVYFDNKLVGDIEVSSGIRQGCTGSPILFVMVLNFIIDRFERERIGFRSGEIRVPCLFFADDGLLIAQSAYDMGRMIGVLEHGANEVGLKINKSKSNIIIYGQDVSLDNIKEIKVTTCIKYLGVSIGIGRNIFHEHKERKILQAKKMSNMTYSIIMRSCNKVLIGKTYWEGVVVPGLLFGSAVVDWNKGEISKLQRSEDDVWRKILGAPGYAPLVSMRGDIGVSTVMAKDMKSKLGYIQYIYKSENVLLSAILSVIIEKKHPYGKILLSYAEI